MKTIMSMHLNDDENNTKTITREKQKLNVMHWNAMNKAWVGNPRYIVTNIACRLKCTLHMCTLDIQSQLSPLSNAINDW